MPNNLRGTRFGSGIGNDDLTQAARDDTWTDPTINTRISDQITYNQILLWRGYIITSRLQGELLTLPDSIRQEVNDGYFRIIPGQGAYTNQSAEYKALYDAHQLFITDIPAIQQSLALDALTVDFSATPVSGTEPLTVNFTNLSTLDTSIYPLDVSFSYEWDFENDSVIDSTEVSPSNIYSNDGLYSVNLEVTNNFGDSKATLKPSYIEVFSAFAYIEVDPNSWLTIPPNNNELGIFTYTGAPRPLEHHYVSHPVSGAAEWNGDFTLKFRVIENEEPFGGSDAFTRLCICGNQGGRLPFTTGAAGLSLVQTGGISLNMWPTATHTNMTFQVHDYGAGTNQTLISLTAAGYHNPPTNVYVLLRRTGDTIDLELYANDDYSTGLITSDSNDLIYANQETLTHFLPINSGGPISDTGDRDLEIELEEVTH
jgi:PKD repeat protein